MASEKETAIAIEDDCNDFRKKFEPWYEGQVTALESNQLAHERAVQQSQEAIAQKKAEVQDLRAQLDDQNRIAAEESARLAAQQAEAEAMRSRLEQLPSHLSALQVQEQQLADSAARTAEEIAQIQDAVKTQTEELRKALLFYKQRLGLEFEIFPGGALKLIFHFVDPAQPLRQFSFVVKPDNASYEVSNVEPELPQLAAIVAGLQATGNFSLFVQHMRRAFRALCV